MRNFSLEYIRSLSGKNNQEELIKEFEKIQIKIEEAAKEGKNYCLYFCSEAVFKYASNELNTLGFKTSDLSHRYPARIKEYKTLGIDW